MITSGWIASLSTDATVVYNDYVAELSGEDVLASIALSLYQQGDNGSVAGDAVGYIRAYGTVGSSHVDVPPSPENNAYFIYGATFVQFRLAVEFAFAYAHAMTMPLSAPGIANKMLVKHFAISDSSSKRVLSHMKFGLLAENSNLDVQGFLDKARRSAAEHHRVPANLLEASELPHGMSPYAGLKKLRLP